MAIEPQGTSIGFIGLGAAPDWRREDMPRVPKPRYTIMRNHMPRVGSLGLDMMHRTATVQVNLDFESEADMAAKFRTSLALQPIATALFRGLADRGVGLSDMEYTRGVIPEAYLDRLADIRQEI